MQFKVWKKWDKRFGQKLQHKLSFIKSKVQFPLTLQKEQNHFKLLNYQAKWKNAKKIFLIPIPCQMTWISWLFLLCYIPENCIYRCHSDRGYPEYLCTNFSTSPSCSFFNSPQILLMQFNGLTKQNFKNSYSINPQTVRITQLKVNTYISTSTSKLQTVLILYAPFLTAFTFPKQNYSKVCK